MVWNSKILSNMQVLCWRLLHNYLPTRSQLNAQGVLLNNQNLKCILCESSIEDDIHLFLNCLIVTDVWSRVFRWTGIRVVAEHNFIRKHFDLFFYHTKSKFQVNLLYLSGLLFAGIFGFAGIMWFFREASQRIEIFSSELRSSYGSGFKLFFKVPNKLAGNIKR